MQKRGTMVFCISSDRVKQLVRIKKNLLYYANPHSSADESQQEREKINKKKQFFHLDCAMLLGIMISQAK